MSNVDKIRRLLAEREVDALFVQDELNQRYLTDFAFSDGIVLITQDHAELITDFRYLEHAEAKANKLFCVSAPNNRKEYISRIFAEDHVKNVGFEGGALSYSDYLNLCESYADVKFVNVGAMVEGLREIKSAEEIARIQSAQDIADNAFSHLLKMITPTMTEIEVAAELEYFMKREGAENAAFETIAVSGDASSVPHGTPRNQRLKPGFLTIDYGAKFEGYCSDMTRTLVIGKADSNLRKLYNTVLNAQKLALEYISVGADCGEADKIARDYIDSFPEFKGTFGHSLGHSLGLYVHEHPSLSGRNAGRKMRCGEVYTVEPGIYLLGKYGCRIEDMVAITDGKLYNFTHSTKELIEIY